MKKKAITKKWHYTAEYILKPEHPVTINVIGAGGNGSQVLNNLARIDQSLKRLGHPGLYVTCFDPDVVTEANMGRQLFSPADIGLSKAVVMITRLNQFFGTSWRAVPEYYDRKQGVDKALANIIISCVDSVKARKEIEQVLAVDGGYLKNYSTGYLDRYNKPIYWLDIGNSQYTGQFVLGTVRPVKQPKATEDIRPVHTLWDVFGKFPGFSDQKDKETGPSCSLAEALEKQDLFINSTLVQLAMGFLWKMFREGRVDYQGAFLNLQTLKIAKISI